MSDNSSDSQGDLGTGALIAQVGLPSAIAEPTLVTYRSAGIGAFGVLMRYGGMPLEKIALFMNSSQVSGKGQFAQAVRLTFKDGLLAPYKVVGPSSITAWFLQYSVMGFAFQFVDHSLSNMMGVKPVYYGSELMEPAPSRGEVDQVSFKYRVKDSAKTIIAPLLAASLESKVSNRAEVQRYFGKETFAQVEQALIQRRQGYGAITRAVGPAFVPSVMRNVIMCQTTFILTPITYKLYFPQEKKSQTSLFWYGLSMNVFVGNVVAITQQALWGRSLDMLAQQGHIDYVQVIKQGLAKEGSSAFFTLPKWSSRVMMNAPAQGVLPWFYNEVLPIGERAILSAVKNFVYLPFLVEMEKNHTPQLPRTVEMQPTFTANSPRC